MRSSSLPIRKRRWEESTNHQKRDKKSNKDTQKSSRWDEDLRSHMERRQNESKKSDRGKSF